jgi:hypothetical protein
LFIFFVWIATKIGQRCVICNSKNICIHTFFTS